jgi:hypothetical protein
MDEAAALRAQVRRLQARLAENGPERPVPSSCDALRFGSESAPAAWFSIAGFDASNAACVGRAETVFNAPGVPGGGFEFRSSNGCNCMVSAVVPLTVGGTVGWDDSAPCYQGNVGLTGVHDAPRT